MKGLNSVVGAFVLVLVASIPVHAQIRVNGRSTSALPTGCTNGQVALYQTSTGTWICGSAGGGGNPFDQDLNTTNSPSFVDLTLTTATVVDTLSIAPANPITGEVVKAGSTAANVEILYTLRHPRSIVASITIADNGVPILQDNGAGAFQGDGIGSGGTNTVDYTTGAMSFSFGAPSTGPVTVTYSYVGALLFETDGLIDTLGGGRITIGNMTDGGDVRIRSSSTSGTVDIQANYLTLSAGFEVDITTPLVAVTGAVSASGYTGASLNALDGTDGAPLTIGAGNGSSGGGGSLSLTGGGGDTTGGAFSSLGGTGTQGGAWDSAGGAGFDNGGDWSGSGGAGAGAGHRGGHVTLAAGLGSDGADAGSIFLTAPLIVASGAVSASGYTASSISAPAMGDLAFACFDENKALVASATACAP